MIAINVLNRCRQSLLVGSVAFVGVLSVGINKPIFAQVTPDDTLGAESSVVTPEVLIREILSDKIDGGAIRGANLFHSFSEFNVGEGRGVYFANPDGIENILSRVTGGNASQILGRLGVLGDANLFLLNPNGILFGENASLDIQGSFAASTASGIKLGEDGVFSATEPRSSRLLSVSPGVFFYNAVAAAGGKITNRGNLATGRNLTLDGENLELQGELRSGSDLTLFAQDTVKVRDSVATPFLAQAGENLTIQGNGGIDIWALNHPTQIPFVSGGDLRLRSDGIISGDARFASGGSFVIQSVSGGLANFVSLNDPIISATGDVDVAANYTGTSLLVEATGNIRFQGGINITGPDTSDLPPGPDTETLRTSTALIMRSGQDTLAYGGVNSGSVPYSTGSVPEGITIGGDVILQPSNGVGGIVDLKAASGDVNTQLISTNGQRTFNLDNDAQGGAISIAANGSINTGGLNSYSLSPSGNAGNGGEINLLAANGINITGKVRSYSYAPNGSAGDGGAIKLSATNDITTDSLDSDSWSNLGTGGNGGAISINTTNGSINTDYLHSYSYSDSGSSGNGGTIRLESGDGIQIRGLLFSDSRSNSGNAGNGGDISLSAANDITIDDHAYANSVSSDGGTAANGGTISLVTANGSINTRNLWSNSSSNSGDAGNGGTISLTAANGSIDTDGLRAYSRSNLGNTGNGGDIRLSAANDITITNGLNSYSWSDSGNAGNGGEINLLAANGINITGKVRSYSYAPNGSAGDGGAIKLSATNDITTDSLDSDSWSNLGTGGNGGAISINTTNGSINTDYLHSYSYSGSGSAGNGGLITLFANGNITTGEIDSQTEGTGNGGNVTLTSTAGEIDTTRGDVTSQIRDNSGGTGNAGTITFTAKGDIRTATLNASAESGNGSLIQLTSTEGTIDTTRGDLATDSRGGNAGDIQLDAFGDITPGEIISTIYSSDPFTHGGDITIVSENGVVRVENNHTITSSIFGAGKGGDINIEGQSIFFDRGFAESNVEEGVSGQGGDINITTRSLSLTNNAALVIRTSGVGNAGSINVNAEQLFMSSNAALIGDLDPNAEGRGGDIKLNVMGTILLRGGITTPTPGFLWTGESTRITIGVLPGGRGDGGTLNINAGSLVLTDGAIVKNSIQGQGNAGNIKVNADIVVNPKIVVNADIVDISGSVPSSGLPSGLFTSTDTDSRAGDITINTQTFRITDGAALSSRTKGDGAGGDIRVNATSFEAVNGGQLVTTAFGQGQAGNIFVNATDRVTISGSDPNYTNRIAKFPNPIDPFVANAITETGPNSGLFANTETNSTGSGGDIILVTTNFNLTDNAQISASTAGRGKGGNLTVTAPEAITIRGQGQLSVETTGDGAAGNLNLDTQRLTIADGATISASTSSPNLSGVGGNITINAPESFHLTNQASLLAQSTGAAKAGNVTINTEQLTADNGSITTSATATSLGEGGSIDVNASQINLKGTEIGLLAETQGVAKAGALTLQPFANGQNLTINLQDNAKISAATSGSGQGGSLSVKAPEGITIRGNGQLSVETTGAGAAGNLSIDTQNLTITDGATISASTSSANPSGGGGSLTINAKESFTLTNQARLLAQSTGAAPAGTITINTGKLTARDGSIETAATQSAGGAINITASDIRLFGDSDITSRVAFGAGGGGNITLTANTIIAFDDSDILAYAADGKGGDITFKTPIFFGFAYAPAPKGTDPRTLDNNDRVDINASGAVEGVITLPDDNAVRNNLTPLSENQIDTNSLIASSCIARRYEPQRGSFFITGTGGIPFRPGDAYVMRYQTGTVRGVPAEGVGEAGEAKKQTSSAQSSVTVSNTNEHSNPTTRRRWKMGDPIIEPTGIYRLPNGELIMSRECEQ